MVLTVPTESESSVPFSLKSRGVFAFICTGRMSGTTATGQAGNRTVFLSAVFTIIIRHDFPPS